MREVRVSVIIPFSKGDVARNTLDKLLQQTYPATLTEVLLVGTRSSIFAERYPIKAIETPFIAFPGAARNIGAHVATGDVFLFLDDDCEPATDWIEQNVLALSSPYVGVVGGQIKGKSTVFFARCVDFSHFPFCQASKYSECVVCSASMGIRREVYEQVGRFNETLRADEDMDFCFRVLKHGYKTIYQPTIKVIHNHGRKDFTTLLRHSHFYGRVSGLYVKRLYPGLSRRNALFTRVQNPFLYFLCIPFFALGATLNIIRVNLGEYPQVLCYAPFIFLSKAANHTGIWQWLRHERQQETPEKGKGH